MKKVFITGIAGFIGFNLAKKLRERGDVVAGCDDFNEYYPAQLKYDRAEQLRLLDVDVKQLDILQIKTLESYLKKEGFTHIINLAAQPGVRYSISHPHSYIKVNIEGFHEILELCKRLPHISLIYASSSSVYGENKKIPLGEDDPVLSPASLYAVSKMTNELMASCYHHLYNFQAIGLRFFTVYGPWGRPDMACYMFAKAIAEGRPIEVFNHGDMLRDFTYIDDIVQGTIGAIDSNIPCEVFNLGKGEFVQLGTAINYIEEYLGKKANIIYKPMQAGDVTSTCADITKSQELLGYNPKTSLKEGMTHFLDWLTEYLEISVSQPEDFFVTPKKPSHQAEIQSDQKQ
jgi:UDP-glucuronate 4-epimerase